MKIITILIFILSNMHAQVPTTCLTVVHRVLEEMHKENFVKSLSSTQKSLVTQKGLGGYLGSQKFSDMFVRPYIYHYQIGGIRPIDLELLHYLDFNKSACDKNCLALNNPSACKNICSRWENNKNDLPSEYQQRMAVLSALQNSSYFNVASDVGLDLGLVVNKYASTCRASKNAMIKVQSELKDDLIKYLKYSRSSTFPTNQYGALKRVACLELFINTIPNATKHSLEKYPQNANYLEKFDVKKTVLSCQQGVQKAIANMKKVVQVARANGQVLSYDDNMISLNEEKKRLRNLKLKEYSDACNWAAKELKLPVNVDIKLVGDIADQQDLNRVIKENTEECKKQINNSTLSNNQKALLRDVAELYDPKSINYKDLLPIMAEATLPETLKTKVLWNISLGRKSDEDQGANYVSLENYAEQGVYNGLYDILDQFKISDVVKSNMIEKTKEKLQSFFVDRNNNKIKGKKDIKVYSNRKDFVDDAYKAYNENTAQLPKLCDEINNKITAAMMNCRMSSPNRVYSLFQLENKFGKEVITKELKELYYKGGIESIQKFYTLLSKKVNQTSNGADAKYLLQHNLKAIKELNNLKNYKCDKPDDFVKVAGEEVLSKSDAINDLVFGQYSLLLGSPEFRKTINFQGRGGFVNECVQNFTGHDFNGNEKKSSFVKKIVNKNTVESAINFLDEKLNKEITRQVKHINNQISDLSNSQVKDEARLYIRVYRDIIRDFTMNLNKPHLQRALLVNFCAAYLHTLYDAGWDKFLKNGLIAIAVVSGVASMFIPGSSIITTGALALVSVGTTVALRVNRHHERDLHDNYVEALRAKLTQAISDGATSYEDYEKVFEVYGDDPSVIVRFIEDSLDGLVVVDLLTIVRAVKFLKNLKNFKINSIDDLELASFSNFIDKVENGTHNSSLKKVNEFLLNNKNLDETERLTVLFAMDKISDESKALLYGQTIESMSKNEVVSFFKNLNKESSFDDALAKTGVKLSQEGVASEKSIMSGTLYTKKLNTKELERFQKFYKSLSSDKQTKIMNVLKGMDEQNALKKIKGCML